MAVEDAIISGDPENFIRITEKFGQFIPTEVILGGRVYFEDDDDDQVVIDLYNEKSNILDGDADTEVDLASYAYQIWKNACDTDPTLKKAIPDMANVVFSTKALSFVPPKPAASGGARPDSGVMVYVRTADGNRYVVLKKS